MENNYKHIFESLKSTPLPKGLYEGVLVRVESERRRSAKIKFILSGATTLISLAAMVPVIWFLLEKFSNSGFYHYMSLLFSDGDIILSYWKEFTLSLMESLPYLEVTILFATIFVLLISLRFAVRNMRAFLLPHIPRKLA